MGPCVLHDRAAGKGAPAWTEPAAQCGPCRCRSLWASCGERRVLVSDLGLVKATLYASGLTETAGDPRYAAPEQGVPSGEVDERADVHALGAIAYYLLAGRPVREAPVRDVASAAEPPLVSEIAEVPYTVANVVRGAVHPDPDERTPDPGLFADGLGVTVALLRQMAERGLDTENLRTPEQVRELEARLTAKAEAAGTASRRPTWNDYRLILGLVVLAIGLVVILTQRAGDDGSASRSTPTLPTLPPSASYYCRNLILNWGATAALSEPTSSATPRRAATWTWIRTPSTCRSRGRPG